MIGMMAGAGAAEGLAKNKWTPIVVVGGVVGVIALVYFGIYRPVMCKFGVIECADDKKIKALKVKIQRNEGFNPNFYDATKLTISHDLAKETADKLYDALYGNDDEEAVYSLLASAKNINNLSLVSKYYFQRKGVSLVDNLVGDMDSLEELTRTYDIIQYRN